MALIRCAGTAALALGSLLGTAARAQDVEVDAAELIRAYRSAAEDYRRHPPRSAASRALVAEAALWNVDVARLAATLAAMHPPSGTTVVRLGVQTAESGDQTPDTERVVEAFGDERELQRGIESRGEDRQRAQYAPRPAPSTQRLRAGDGPHLAAELPADRGGEDGGPRGACLVATDSRRCADLLKAAALLHTAVADLEQDRGGAARAQQHRVVAGWLLWHLPRKAEDEAFVRDWFVVAVDAARGRGALASARQLSRLALERFPEDPSLLLWAARSGEALASLCYEEDGTPLTGADCLEFTVALDGSQPPAMWPRAARLADRKAVLRETERDLEALARLRPDDPEVRLRYGRALAARGRDDQARRVLTPVAGQATEGDLVALTHLFLGRLAEARGDSASALEQASAAFAAAPRSQTARMALAAARLAAGDRDGAVALAAAPQQGTGQDLWPDFLVGPADGSGAAFEALHARVRLP
jgi:tetratricopeptide (TPR) repeat protein